MASETESDTLVLGDQTQIDLSSISIDEGSDRYDRRSLLGRGGVGEVHLCKDNRLGRSIAMKMLRPEFDQHTNIELRFLQEAYLQGQLEHPSIVPVYDIGRAPNGSAYFTMRCVRGRTLDAIIAGLSKRDAAFTRRYSRRKLLAALSNACLTLEFAHARGVIHRDLKPANLMLGDFGEVYVLDWGIAKVSGGEALETPAPTPHTAEGSVVGTPGYMAPEQMSSARGTLSPASDIYSLGAILFEVLALETLHARGSLGNAIMSTLGGVNARPSDRAPSLQIPPELDEICMKATAGDPADRYASAREMSEAIERFLDGDLDLERRRRASLELTAGAHTALSRREHEARAEAMQLLSRALALDPSNQSAVGAMVGVLLNPPDSLPPEAENELAELQAQTEREAAKTGTKGMIALFGGVALLWWTGVFGGTAAGATVALVAVAAVLGILDSRASRPRLRIVVALVGSMALALMTRVAGPLLVPPVLVLALLAPILLNSPRSQHWLIICVGVAAIAGPLLLELANVLPASTGRSTLLAQGAIAIGSVYAALAICSKIISMRSQADQRLRLHEWYLRRLIRGT